MNFRASLAVSLAFTGAAFTISGLSGCANNFGANQPGTISGASTPALSPASAPIAPKAPAPLTGEAALGDWSTDAPGVRRKLTPKDLPAPFATKSVDNGPRRVPRPANAWPKAPEGFEVQQFSTNVENPRVLVTAPNGDIFVAESGPGRVKVLRDSNGDGKPEATEVYASGLRQPFGIAFYPVGPNPQYVYVANTDSVVRFPYKSGDLKATTGEPELVTNTIPGGGRLRGGGHWTRDLVFSPDSKKMYVSVGSLTNVNQENNPIEANRALIFEFKPDGTNGRIFASGIRNPVGLAIQPGTGTLWTSVNERDGLGDHLVPDYVTSVKDGGFYGWPWYYIGANEDPRKKGERPDLKDKVIVPDVLLQSHSASLDLTFYTGNNFPKEYRGHIFACEHGSWNRERRTGYKVVRIPIDKNKATGEYEDFLTGFVSDDANVWGRPVGVTVARDGSLLVSDDGSGTIWRVVYRGK
jgi:glucose/arabinose dehydrogenase